MEPQLATLGDERDQIYTYGDFPQNWSFLTESEDAHISCVCLKKGKNLNLVDSSDFLKESYDILRLFLKPVGPTGRFFICPLTKISS